VKDSVKDYDAIRVFIIIDDSVLVREALIALLNEQNDILVVGITTDNPEALRYLPSTHPDVLLLDLTLPNTDSIKCIGWLRQAYPTIPILVLASFTDDPCVVAAALQAGAVGYIPKDARRMDVLSALRVVIALHSSWYSREKRAMRG
jgi:DNA-binding NarL/FixJ family response regulator